MGTACWWLGAVGSSFPGAQDKKRGHLGDWASKDGTGVLSFVSVIKTAHAGLPFGGGRRCEELLEREWQPTVHCGRGQTRTHADTDETEKGTGTHFHHKSLVWANFAG